MNMKKYLLALFIIPVLFFVFPSPASAQNESILGPASRAGSWGNTPRQVCDFQYGAGVTAKISTSQVAVNNLATACDRNGCSENFGIDVRAVGCGGRELEFYGYNNEYYCGLPLTDKGLYCWGNTAPPPPPPENRTLAILAPLSGDVWRANEPNEIAWTSQNLTGDVVIKRYAVSDSAGLNPLGTATVSVADGSYNVAANVLGPGAYYYVLTAGGLTARSGNFRVVGEEGPPGGGNPYGWKAPMQRPTECHPSEIGCYPPVNISSILQTKTGPLMVTGFRSRFDAFFSTKATFEDEVCIGGVCRNTWPTAGPGGGISRLNQGTGITLTPNPITAAANNGEGTISANFNEVQQRITSECPAGQAIRVINQTGGVTCQAAGTGTVPSCTSATPYLRWDNNAWTCAAGTGSGLAGSGTAGTLPVWTGSTSLEDSTIKQVNASTPSGLFKTVNITNSGMSAGGGPVLRVGGWAASDAPVAWIGNPSVNNLAMGGLHGLTVQTASETAAANILNLQSGSATSRFSVKGDGQVCIGNPATASNCRTTWPTGGVSKITAGTNVTISPTTGLGDVTINSTGGAGDNLGDHTATQNIKLNGKWLSGDQNTLARGIKITNGSGSEIIIGNEGGGAPVWINSSSLRINATPPGTNDPATGKVLTAKDSSGRAEWRDLPSVVINDGSITGDKLGVTYDFLNCIDRQWGGASTACELGRYKFCALSGVRDADVACSVLPTTSRATSFSDFLSKSITSGSISGVKWWYISANKGGLFQSGACRAICY